MKLGQEGDLKVFNVSLTVTYSIYNQLIEITKDSYENSCPTFSMLDAELNKDGTATLEVSKLEEITLLIKDFEKKFKQLTS